MKLATNILVVCLALVAVIFAVSAAGAVSDKAVDVAHLEQIDRQVAVDSIAAKPCTKLTAPQPRKDNCSRISTVSSVSRPRANDVCDDPSPRTQQGMLAAQLLVVGDCDCRTFAARCAGRRSVFWDTFVYAPRLRI